jgi:hypothetical protein
VDLDHVRRPLPVEAPDVLAEHLAGHDLAVVPHEQLEDAELGGREVDVAAVQGEPLRGDPEPQWLDHDFRCGLVRGAALHRLDPGQQLVDRERLDEVVVRPRLEGGELVGHGPACGEHDHRGADAGGPGVGEHVEPACARQHEVEHDQVVREERLLADGLRAVGHPVTPVPAFGDRPAHGLRHDRIVLDDRDVHDGTPFVRVRRQAGGHSHSIVAGGFDDISYTTRFTPRTSLMTRVEIRARTS